MHRLLYGTFFLILGVACGLSILIDITRPFLNAAVSAIFLAKGIFWVYVYKARRVSDLTRNTMMGKGLCVLSMGAFLSSILFLAAANNQEWSYGYLAAPFVFGSGVVMSVAARRTSHGA